MLSIYIIYSIDENGNHLIPKLFKNKSLIEDKPKAVHKTNAKNKGKMNLTSV